MLAAGAGGGAAVLGAILARDAPHRWGELLRAILVVAWASVGLTVTIRRPAERLGPLVLVGTVIGGLASLAGAMLQAHGGGMHLSADAVAAAQLARPATVALLPVVAMHVLLGLPDGACRVARSAVGLGYLAGVAIGVALWTQRPDLPLWPVAVEAVLTSAAGVVGANHRYRRSKGIERQRMQWFGWAMAVGCEVALVAVAIRLLSGWPADGSVIAAAATIPLPVALVIGSSKSVISHIDRLLAATVSLFGVSGVVVAVYLVVVVGLGRVPTHQERSLLVLSMAAAAIAALLYVPARNRLAGFANRLVYGERESPDQVLRTFGTRLTRAIPMDELLLQVAESLRKTLALEAAEIWTGSEGRLERAVSVPDVPVARLSLNHDEETVVTRAGVSGPAWLAIWLPELLVGREQAIIRVAPINHSGRLLGLIAAVRPEAGDNFGADDDTVLAELARQLGLALHNVQLDSALQASLEEVKHQADELRASRSRIVAASDAARRQIERNLHDGAQQHLVALAVNLRLARQLSDVDPDGVKEMLDQLSHDIGDAVQELRDLAHGIYPPLLMDRGLGPALNAAAGRAAIPTDVVYEGGARYRPEVEAAVYFCCLEALQNAAKHAGPGATARIRVLEEADSLVFEVADDGVGFDPASQAASGHGFVNMGDRVGAIGGVFSLSSSIGQGTTIGGRIPLATAGSA
ncbi:MAG: histidine kinase [Actinomycetota bacterium]|nr:histidine kinase [Actinomycetota bacterium]